MSFLTQWWGGSSKSPEPTSLPIPPAPPSSSEPNGSPSPPSDSPGNTNQLQPPSSSSQQRNQRIPNNLKILLGGVAFFALTNLITRRSLTRRRLASIPPFYTGSIYFKPDISGAME